MRGGRRDGREPGEGGGGQGEVRWGGAAAGIFFARGRKALLLIIIIIRKKPYNYYNCKVSSSGIFFARGRKPWSCAKKPSREERFMPTCAASVGADRWGIISLWYNIFIRVHYIVSCHIIPILHCTKYYVRLHRTDAAGVGADVDDAAVERRPVERLHLATNFKIQYNIIYIL